eukprot:1161606-Pelagomonas_calceolata.AAC.17
MQGWRSTVANHTIRTSDESSKRGAAVQPEAQGKGSSKQQVTAYRAHKGRMHGLRFPIQPSHNVVQCTPSHNIVQCTGSQWQGACMGSVSRSNIRSAHAPNLHARVHWTNLSSANKGLSAPVRFTVQARSHASVITENPYFWTAESSGTSVLLSGAPQLLAVLCAAELDVAQPQWWK